MVVVLDGHESTCECKHCEMARGYVAMGTLELIESTTYEQVENEATELYAWSA